VVMMLKAMVGPDLVTLTSQLAAGAETTAVWVGCETTLTQSTLPARGAGPGGAMRCITGC
jgi:hypothetical protein